MNGKRAFLFAIVALILTVLIGIEAGIAMVSVLDYALAHGKTYFVDHLLGEVRNERESI